jgi:hypothetical protein
MFINPKSIERKRMALSKDILLPLLLILCGIAHASSSFSRSISNLKKSVSELEDSYDYVIIGGGTSGLTVAERLTEDPTSQ